MLVYIMQRGRQKWVFDGLFLIAALVVLVSVVEIVSWYFGLGFAGFGQGWLSIGGLSDPIPPYIYRLALAFNVSTWLGNFVILALPLTLAWAYTARKRDDRRALKMVSVGLGFVLVLSQTRGAWLGAVAVTGTWLAVHFLMRQGNIFAVLRQRRVQIGLAIFGASAALIVGLVLYVSLNRDASDQGRIALWENALNITTEHPVTGGGVYQFCLLFPRKCHTQ